MHSIQVIFPVCFYDILATMLHFFDIPVKLILRQVHKVYITL